MTDTHDLALRMYRALSGSRMAEQSITDLARSNTLPGHHSGLGHESVGVGVGLALAADDPVLPSHRSGLMLAHARDGITLREAILAKFLRAPGCFGPVPGRPRVLPTVGLVGSGLPMAVGVAMAARLTGRQDVTVAFFGDGAANEGAVHEALNLAGAQRAPIVFVLENNGLAISTPVAASTAAHELIDRAKGYGLPGNAVDGQDVEAVFAATQPAVQRARAGLGPSMIEVRLERWEPHAHGLADLRSPAEIEAARMRDGLALFRARLLERAMVTVSELEAIDRRCRDEVDDAVAEALALGMDLTEPAPCDDATAYRLSYRS